MINPTNRPKMKINTIAELSTEGKKPEVLFWVGCAGSFDDRYKKVTVAFAEILTNIGVEFAILGEEETCTGDPARRAGNEFLFQMQALSNIETLNGYGIQKIVTACPHCFNTLKNEYPDLGGEYEVYHHTQYLQSLIEDGRLKPSGKEKFHGKTVTFHDSCYLGRANSIYEAPRKLLEQLDINLTEMKRSKENGLCCGAGGAQMFKDAEKGNKEINIERVEEAISTKAETIVTACPFCMTMMTDGVKNKKLEEKHKVVDIAEMILATQGEVNS